MDDRDSWTRYQPGLSGTTAPLADGDIAARRYDIEPHILEVVPFPKMTGVVAELGCGVGTDGQIIAKYADKYIGIDFSPLALTQALGRHEAIGIQNSHFIRSDLRQLPLRDSSCDFLYSHGVVHHIRNSSAVWDEAHRILRPNGRFCFMVYHRNAVNYYFGILVLRRLLLLLSLVAPRLANRIAAQRRESEDTVRAHAERLRAEGISYLSGEGWLSRNTDGPQNTYSRVYSCAELKAELAEAGLSVDRFEVRYLNVRVNPPFGVLPERLVSFLGRRAGWHLYALGHKPVQRRRPLAVDC